nr:ribonuclease H-like domain-containing protein [Tanacetum cinerariifolium]
MAETNENTTNPQQVPPTPQASHTLSTIKLLILKKGEYDIWAIKIEYYLEHTDYPIWELIQKGNGPVQVSTDINGQIRVLPPKTAEEILARERERKARTTLLIAIPEDHLAKFHKMTDAKEMWKAIKSRFRGNDESKKMHKYLLKQQFESFSVSNLEGLHKGYDRFQSLLGQLETHGAGVSTEDANQKFLRSLHSFWSQVSSIIRTKPRVDTLNFDDLYNNLIVFESDVKGSTRSSSSIPNVAFVSANNTSSTNEVNITFGLFTSSGHNLQKEGSTSYTGDLMYSFFANQSSGPQLDHEDLEQVDEFDIEEMDLKWQVAMISTRLKKFYKKTGRKLHYDVKEHVSFNKSKVECFNYHNTGHFARECRSKRNQDSRRRDVGNTRYKAKDNRKRPAKQDEHKAMVIIDEEGVDWTGHAEDETEDYALTAFNSSNSGLDTEKLLAEVEKEKEELKTKLENFQSSSKGLSKLLNSQMSAKDKSRLVCGSQIHDGVLRYENEFFASVFDSRSSDVKDSLVNDRFEKVKGMHAIPPHMTGNYMPPKSNFVIDESNFTYGPKQSTTSEFDAKTSDLDSCDSSFSKETLETMLKLVKSKPKVVSEPKVWTDAPIIEEFESNSDDEHVTIPSKEQEPSFAFVNTVEHVKPSSQTAKEQNTCNKNPKPSKSDWNGLMSKKLGLEYGFTKKACFVYGSFSHLIRDCDFHEKRWLNSEPKVWTDAPIIEEFESNSDDEHVTIPSKEQEPSFAFVNTVEHVKPSSQTAKEQNTCNKNPKPSKRDWNGLMSKKLGLEYGFTKKACFVYGSFSHLIRDCDFHEKRWLNRLN